MKYTLFFITLLLAHFSTFSQDKKGEVIPADTSMKFYQNKELVLTPHDVIDNYYRVKIDSGDYYVFEFSYKRAQNTRIADDEYAETIYFQVPVDSRNFSVEGDSIHSLKPVWNWECFCNKENYKFVDGYIRGNKTGDNTWHIAFYLKNQYQGDAKRSNDTKTRKVEGKFCLSEK